MAKGKKTYTKAQKAAYAKKMAGKSKKPKTTVAKQNQFRTEYKDRVSTVKDTTLAVQPEDPEIDSYPDDSVVLLPEAFVNGYIQGTKNGNIDGNQINMKYLNMKVELNFKDLPSLVKLTEAGPTTFDQNYEIEVRQCLILQDISEYLDKIYTNDDSGRTQPAFDTLSPNNTPAELMLRTASAALRRGQQKADPMTYERRQDNKVRVLKTINVRGKMDNRISASITHINPATSQPTPNQVFSFNWKCPAQKMQLQPAIGADNALVYHSPGKAFIPCIMITCHRSKADFELSAHPLNIRSISHFTYTDN